MMSATYSPDDNKLRLYASARLDADTYARVRGAGFIWAPKQDLFVAPMWTPDREDLLIELCGEVGDDDRSLVDRAEDRADRFVGYQGKRAHEAERAHEAVNAIASNIPFGQPILVGHHSERHARKDAERIENGMRKAIRLWDTSQYWKARAAGALAHAKYKERADVRARRIKTIEADKRRHERATARATKLIAAWRVEPLTLARAKAIANVDHVSKCFTLAEFPRLTPDASTYEGSMSLWSALDGIITPEQARDIAIRVHERGNAHRARWIAHTSNRIEYERAMLAEQGAADLLAPKARPKQLPLCNYRAPEGITIENPYARGSMLHYPQIEMTQAEYTAVHTDYRGTRVAGNSHRFRTMMRAHTLYCVFLTDAKTHARPADVPKAPPAPRVTVARATSIDRTEAAQPFDAMRESLRQGVQTVSAPQLFPTPADVAARVVELAQLAPGLAILEPSAGTGAILRAILHADRSLPRVTAVEIDRRLVDRLTAAFPHVAIRCADFLACNGDLGTFDRIVMNPPFTHGADVRHILHARHMLRPGGRLVAICANGPKQREALEPIADAWIDLPDGTFAEAGTHVRAAIVVLSAE